MKFMVEFLPGACGVTLTAEQTFALVQPEFAAVNGQASLVELDAYSAFGVGDSPFEQRRYAETAVVVDIPDLATLVDYASTTGRVISIMEASAWSMSGTGSTLLTHRLYVNHGSYCERDEH
jgi:hypothetical protein